MTTKEIDTKIAKLQNIQAILTPFGVCSIIFALIELIFLQFIAFGIFLFLGIALLITVTSIGVDISNLCLLGAHVSMNEMCSQMIEALTEETEQENKEHENNDTSTED